jgi:hypothetical protein
VYLLDLNLSQVGVFAVMIPGACKRLVADWE